MRNLEEAAEVRAARPILKDSYGTMHHPAKDQEPPQHPDSISELQHRQVPPPQGPAPHSINIPCPSSWDRQQQHICTDSTRTGPGQQPRRRLTQALWCVSSGHCLHAAHLGTPTSPPLSHLHQCTQTCAHIHMPHVSHACSSRTDCPCLH